MVSRELHAYFALIVVDFSKRAIVVSEHYAFYRVALRLSTAGTYSRGLPNQWLLNFNLAIYGVTCVEQRRLEVIRVSELDRTQTNRVAVFEEKCNLRQFRDLFQVVSLQVALFRPFKVDFVVLHIRHTPEWKFSQLDQVSKSNRCQFILLQKG